MDHDSSLWDERYAEKPLLWSEEPNLFVAQDLAVIEPGRALDLACGEGRNAVWLARLGWDVTGVDFSAVAIDRARQMGERAGVSVEWVQADVMTWEPDGSYDLVVVAYVHFPHADRIRMMARAAEWLTPGGRLYMVGHDVATAGVSGPPDPDLLWDPESAAASVAALNVDYSERRKRSTKDGDEAIDTVLMAVKP